MGARFILFLLIGVGVLSAQPKRVLYVTHSAGYRHESIPISRQVMEGLDRARLDVVSTEDLSMLSAATLRNFDAVFFFTSGELALTPQQKSDLLEFVRSGKGFGGAHSATDTLYAWPEYGELIGARFDGHPWVHEVKINVEDPDHPATRHLPPEFSIVDEIYQFREFSRDRVRVLMTLDPGSVNLAATGVNRKDHDFALAWCRPFGAGRAFYTALGHFDGTWQDERFRTMLREALLWLTGATPGDATPRPIAKPEIGTIGNSATVEPKATVAPGSLISIFGRNLSTGSALGAQYATRVLGTSVKLGAAPLPLLYVSPAQINAYVPFGIEPGPIEVTVASGANTASSPVRLAPLTPGVFAVTTTGGVLSVWATGLGPFRGDSTEIRPTATVGGAPARVLFSGAAPGFLGLYQVNIEAPVGAAGVVRLTFGDASYTLATTDVEVP